MSDIGVNIGLDALAREKRRKLAVRRSHAHQVDRHRVEDVKLALQERQPARLRFLDDGDFDPVDQRYAAGPAGAPTSAAS